MTVWGLFVVSTLLIIYFTNIYFTNNICLPHTGVCLSVPGRGGGRLGNSCKEKRRNAERAVKGCPGLGSASRGDTQGERSSAAVSISSAGIAKKAAGWATPSNWLGMEPHGCILLRCLKAVAGEPCLDHSTGPWLKLAHGVETFPRAALITRQSWHDVGILSGCYLTLWIRHYTWSHPENLQPACERGNHSLTRRHHVPAPQTKPQQLC